MTRNIASGGYRVFSALDDDGPEPAAGQFYMLATESGWARRGRPPLPGPRLLRRRLRAASRAGCGSTSSSTTSAPGPSGSGALEPRRAPLDHRPARPAVRAAVASSARTPPARSWSAAASASRRWRSGAGAWRTPAIPTRVLLGFRDRERSGGHGPVPTARDAGSRPRTATRATAATSPTCSRCCSRATTPAAPPSTPAGRRRCSRRCGCSAPSGASPASWRWRRRWPAASAPASAAPSRSPTGGYMRLCVDGPVVRGEEIETALVPGQGTDGSTATRR